ncbi:MAG: ribosome-associated translation inhibitor RaiA [Rhodocyclaceae bacterium]|nr:ribosome-associated translation inhibitor RaiA [Rhodocyclaceae bacterium]MBX3668732.1 ribosome-associated translation inhibitor RaiA [Rhodocyclaceae bacterium]
MNLSITGHHLEITPSIREYISSKLERVTRHFDHVTSASVVLEVEKLRQKAEVTLHVRGKDINVKSDAEDLYAAIDLLIDKLDRQILKHKDKRNDHGHEAIKHQVTE